MISIKMSRPSWLEGSDWSHPRRPTASWQVLKLNIFEINQQNHLKLCIWIQTTKLKIIIHHGYKPQNWRTSFMIYGHYSNMAENEDFWNRYLEIWKLLCYYGFIISLVVCFHMQSFKWFCWLISKKGLTCRNAVGLRGLHHYFICILQK